MFDTIVAISTALQDGAISIIRMSGPESLSILERLLLREMKNEKSHTVHYGWIVDEHQEVVDEVLVSIFKAPRTYTREDVVEINCHGSSYIARKIVSLCLAYGARLARAGEFTQRAFLNGRLDLSQAEAVYELIESSNQQQARKAISGLKGSIKRLIDPLCEQLLSIIAHIEVNIDYPEYDDVDVLTSEVLLPQAIAWQQQLSDIIKKSQHASLMKRGIKTVILGKPNVGKSSLLNALLEEDKAIVTDIAGTTRDLVEGYVQCEKVMLHLIDTAGIRETSDKIEKIGIEKSVAAIDDADLCILVVDGSKELDEEDNKLLELTKHKTTILVSNKKDIAPNDVGINISALNNDISQLITAINTTYEEEIKDFAENTLSNQRQIGLCIQAQEAMSQAITSMKEGYDVDCVTIDLQKAYQCCKDVIGEFHKEDYLDALFSKFCLGK